MQTFLPVGPPYSVLQHLSIFCILELCFRASLAVLDNRRIGKQRVEALQLIKAIELRAKAKQYDPNDIAAYFKDKGLRRPGWISHVCTLMWEDHLEALKLYMNCAIKEWCTRKNKDGRPTKNTMKLVHVDTSKITRLPPFIGDDEFHAVHRSNLIYKDAEYYGQALWTEEPCTGYIWILSKGERRDMRTMTINKKSHSPVKKSRISTVINVY